MSSLSNQIITKLYLKHFSSNWENEIRCVKRQNLRIVAFVTKSHIRNEVAQSKEKKRNGLAFKVGILVELEIVKGGTCIL